MRDEEDILSKRERFINSIFYLFRYILYLIAFSCLWVIIGKFFSAILVIIFWFLAQYHIECEAKIQKSIMIQENCKYEKILKKINNKGE